MADAESLVDSVGVVAVEPADELLHPPVAPDDPTATETSFLGFNVPERDLNCAIHHWLHPVLGLVSGGVILISGEAENAAFADYIDYHPFMPMARVTSMTSSIRAAFGLGSPSPWSWSS